MFETCVEFVKKETRRSPKYNIGQMLLACIAAALITIMTMPFSGLFKTSPVYSIPMSIKTSDDNMYHVGSATTGELFSGKVVAKFEKPRLFTTEEQIRKINFNYLQESSVIDTINCDKWSVVTTIFEPSDAVKKQSNIDGWCLVVVGDKKGPLAYDIGKSNSTFVFLDEQRQLELASRFEFIKLLPWNHFGRKNVGFFYAIMHGAKVIWDFDDDNILINDNMQFTFDGMKSSEGQVNSIFNDDSNIDIMEPSSYKSNVFNPYPKMVSIKSSNCSSQIAPWPRGFPLEYIKGIEEVSSVDGARIGSNDENSLLRHEDTVMTTRTISAASIGIVQSLANNDPDVDAIYRLTQPLPLNFPTKGHLVAPPPHSFSPYNAQATLHKYSALWSLLLPVTVHGRVSDIWRSYFFQRIARDYGIRVVFW